MWFVLFQIICVQPQVLSYACIVFKMMGYVYMNVCLVADCVCSTTSIVICMYCVSYYAYLKINEILMQMYVQPSSMNVIS